MFLDVLVWKSQKSKAKSRVHGSERGRGSTIEHHLHRYGGVARVSLVAQRLAFMALLSHGVMSPFLQAPDASRLKPLTRTLFAPKSLGTGQCAWQSSMTDSPTVVVTGQFPAWLAVACIIGSYIVRVYRVQRQD